MRLQILDLLLQVLQATTESVFQQYVLDIRRTQLDSWFARQTFRKEAGYYPVSTALTDFQQLHFCQLKQGQIRPERIFPISFLVIGLLGDVRLGHEFLRMFLEVL